MTLVGKCISCFLKKPIILTQNKKVKFKQISGQRLKSVSESPLERTKECLNNCEICT